MFTADDPIVAELLARSTLMHLASAGAHHQRHAVPTWRQHAAGRFPGPGADACNGRMEARVKRQVRITTEPKSWPILDFVKRSPKSPA